MMPSNNFHTNTQTHAFTCHVQYTLYTWQTKRYFPRWNHPSIQQVCFILVCLSSCHFVCEYCSNYFIIKRYHLPCKIVWLGCWCCLFAFCWKCTKYKCVSLHDRSFHCVFFARSCFSTFSLSLTPALLQIYMTFNFFYAMVSCNNYTINWKGFFCCLVTLCWFVLHTFIPIFISQPLFCCFFPLLKHNNPLPKIIVCPTSPLCCCCSQLYCCVGCFEKFAILHAIQNHNLLFGGVVCCRWLHNAQHTMWYIIRQ